MFQTSYFAKAGTLPHAISIARSAPPFYHGPVYRPLAPPQRLIEEFRGGGMTAEQYTSWYTLEILNRLDAGTVVTDIATLAGPDAILLCWEKPGRFCHRHLVAAWIRAEIGIDVGEMT